jgi:hypothetical protein
MKAILYLNGIEVKRAEYPRKDMALVEGLEAGLEWKLIQILVAPVFDKNIERIQYRETVTGLPHPDYPHLSKVVFDYEIIPFTQAELDAKAIAAAKDDFKNNQAGAFAFATTPDGTKEYAIKIGNDGKIVTVLIP